MAPNRVEKMKATARVQPKRNLRATKAVEEETDHLCLVCYKSFSSAQALGGHKNAHRRDREEARNGSAQSTRWVPASPPSPLMHGRVYVMGHPQFMCAPQSPSGGLTPVPGPWSLQRYYAGEGSVPVPDTGPLLGRLNSSSRELENVGSFGVSPAGHGADEKEDEGPSGIDLTLHL